jgi:hypothetical protein
MAQTQTQRRSTSITKPATRSSSLSYDRSPGQSRSRKPGSTTPQAPHTTHNTTSRSTTRAPNSQPRRRSASAQRHPTAQIRINESSARDPHRHHLPSHHSRNSLQPEGSDAGSIASAPNLKQNPLKSEFREPSSTKSGGKKLYREDSPANSKKSHPETPQKHTKTARKVIEGELVSLVFFSSLAGWHKVCMNTHKLTLCSRYLIFRFAQGDRPRWSHCCHHECMCRVRSCR